jgi:hypothetical protein
MSPFSRARFSLFQPPASLGTKIPRSARDQSPAHPIKVLCMKNSRYVFIGSGKSNFYSKNQITALLIE